MMRVLLFAAVGVVGTITAAQAEWTPYKDVPLDDSPITIALQGWENGDWRRINRQREWPPISNNCTATHTFTILQKNDYRGFLDFREASFTCDFRLDSIRTMVERNSAFKDSQIEFGNYDTVYNGAAEYRYMMFTSVKNSVTSHCIGFNATWRTFLNYGVLCSDKTPLSEANGRTFLKSIGYKNALSPVAGKLE